MDYLTIGSTPHGEPCSAVGSPDYDRMSRIECRIYLEQLRRAFPEPELGYFKVKSFPHDFGTYREVCAVYDENDREACEWAFEVEGNSPENWDEESIQALLEALKPEAYYS